jgi:XTP/dITP diphosphohydrolase
VKRLELLLGVVVASKNVDKITEVEAVLAALDPPVTVIPGHVWDDVDETEDTLAGNALLKARAVVAATGHAAIADDTALEVDALGGAPGVTTARYAGVDASYGDNVDKMLRELGDTENRSARFRTAVALVTPEGEELVVEGVLEGVITTERRGEGGFGYDPIFEVDGRTLAEIPAEEKNRISHRARALQALGEKLRTQGSRPE